MPHICSQHLPLHVNITFWKHLGLFLKAFSLLCFWLWNSGLCSIAGSQCFWKQPLNWEISEVCSTLSPKVHQGIQFQEPVAITWCIIHLPSASFPSHTLIPFLESPSKLTYNNWILVSACFWGDLEVYFSNVLIYFTYLVIFSWLIIIR